MDRQVLLKLWGQTLGVSIHRELWSSASLSYEDTIINSFCHFSEISIRAGPLVKASMKARRANENRWLLALRPIRFPAPLSMTVNLSTCISVLSFSLAFGFGILLSLTRALCTYLSIKNNLYHCWGTDDEGGSCLDFSGTFVILIWCYS